MVLPEQQELQEQVQLPELQVQTVLMVLTVLPERQELQVLAQLQEQVVPQVVQVQVV